MLTVNCLCGSDFWIKEAMVDGLCEWWDPARWFGGEAEVPLSAEPTLKCLSQQYLGVPHCTRCQLSVLCQGSVGMHRVCFCGIATSFDKLLSSSGIRMLQTKVLRCISDANTCILKCEHLRKNRRPRRSLPPPRTLRLETRTWATQGRGRKQRERTTDKS